MPTTISAAQLIKKRSEAQFVTVLACILSMGEPTKFRFEAPLRYWLRTHWCLMGCSWQQADDRAAQLIARAYEKLHVIRPMWEDGQPPIPDGNYIKSWFCKACGELLTSTKPGQMYCNRRCLSRAFERKKKRNLEQARRAVSKNAIAKWSAKQPEQTCETCGEKFRPKYPTPKPARFCSTKCRVKQLSQFRKERAIGKGLPDPTWENEARGKANGHANGKADRKAEAHRPSQGDRAPTASPVLELKTC